MSHKKKESRIKSAKDDPQAIEALEHSTTGSDSNDKSDDGNRADERDLLTNKFVSTGNNSSDQSSQSEDKLPELVSAPSKPTTDESATVAANDHNDNTYTGVGYASQDRANQNYASQTYASQTYGNQSVSALPAMTTTYRPAPVSVRPKKGLALNIFISSMVALCCAVLGFAIGTRMQVSTPTRINTSPLNEAYQVISSKYDGKISKEKLLQGAIRGMVDATGDEHTQYFTDEEYKEFFSDLSGKITGIGAELGYKNGYLTIRSVVDDSPAAKNGLKAEDIISKVDGQSVSGLTLTEAVAKIRGDRGTKVTLTIVRDNKEFTVDVIRDVIDNPSVKWKVLDGNIGYIRISVFGSDTAVLMNQAGRELKNSGVQKIILDLRGNSGGYVDAAQGVASVFLPDNTIITKEKRGSKVLSVVRASGDQSLVNSKIVVLIDGGSASASEIVAGALRDKAGAKLLGVTSYGKGSVQEVVDLPSSNGKIKVTVAKWYTPNGTNIDKTGLKPDVKVELTNDDYNNGNDKQLNAAVELLKN